jgi:transposase InsO family protein
MDKDIRERVRNCQICAMRKPAQNTRWGLLASEVAELPMQKLLIDYVGKLPRSKAGHSALLVCFDAFSKFVWMIPAHEVTSQSAIRALEQRIFSNFSVPEMIVTDNARCFTSNEFRKFCFGLGIKQITTSLYYPQPSQSERFNKNLRSDLIAYHCDAHRS